MCEAHGSVAAHPNTMYGGVEEAERWHDDHINTKQI